VRDRLCSVDSCRGHTGCCWRTLVVRLGSDEGGTVARGYGRSRPLAPVARRDRSIELVPNRVFKKALYHLFCRIKNTSFYHLTFNTLF